ncbi:MAG: c-type cytochrome [Firmicutes bacterium]|nr:c-type cytochrome [Bacillota bacterium]
MRDTGHTGYLFRRIQARRWLLGVTAAAAAVLLNLGPAATPAVVEENQVAQGRQIYQDNCAKCHGRFLEGQGGTARLAGSGSRARQNYRNAQELYDFISTAMPMDRPGSLAPEEYWALVAFIWSANGMDPGPAIIGPENAAQLTWTSRPAAAPPAGPQPGSNAATSVTGSSLAPLAGAAGVVLLIGGMGLAIARRRKNGGPMNPVDPPVG